MYKIVKILSVALIVCGCVSCDQLKDVFGFQQQNHVVGGYSKPHDLSDGEQAIFEQATANLEGVEYKPMNVATQIVAGVNYRFLCKARRVDENGKKGKRFYAVIVVHKPLSDGELRILSIEKQQK